MAAPPSSKVYTLADLKAHATEADCWILVHGKVYDVTAFLDEHPGGFDIIVSNTSAFVWSVGWGGEGGEARARCVAVARAAAPLPQRRASRRCCRQWRRTLAARTLLADASAGGEPLWGAPVRRTFCQSREREGTRPPLSLASLALAAPAGW